MSFPLLRLCAPGALGLALALTGWAAETPMPPAGDAAAAWQHLAAQATAPEMPPAWRNQEPPRPEVAKWMGPEGERLLRVAEEARTFARLFPTDSNVASARRKEEEALLSAVKLGVKEAESQLRALDQAQLQDPQLTPERRLAIRMRQVQQAGQARLSESNDAAMNAYLDGARALVKEFPGQPEPFGMFLQVAEGEEEALARQLATEVLKSNPPPQIQQLAQGLVNRLDLVGKPLHLEFKSLDGRDIDLSQMSGRPVLLDFWATWCKTCVDRLPRLQSLTEKPQARSVQVIGISLDENKARVEDFLKTRAITWPQLCEGKGWGGDFVKYFGLRSIPALWLLDSHGVVRDLHAEVNLEQKVEQLLAEKE